MLVFLERASRRSAVMGRGFVDADTRDGATAVIVNRTLAERIAGSGNVLGRRVRNVVRSDDAAPRSTEANRWSEIVGVVPDVPNPVWWFDEAQLKLYYPAALGQAGSVVLALRMSHDPGAGFAGGRLRSIAAAVDPALQLHDLGTAAEARREERQRVRFYRAADRGPDPERPAAVGGGDLCDDVVHGYAAAARDRQPRSARRAYARNPQRHLPTRGRAARNGCDGRPDPGGGARLANRRVAHGRPVAPRAPRRRGVGHGNRAACGARPGTARLAVQPTEALREE